jgi:FkbM family methyltransferase
MVSSLLTRFMPQRSVSLRLRSIVLRALRRANLGDVTIRHHYTDEPFRLHSFRHRGYWYFAKHREGETMALFAEIITNGDFVVEIGGHIGYMSLYFAHLVGSQGRVVVFEPGPNNLPYIRTNVQHHPNVRLIEEAVTDFTGSVTLYTEDLSGQNNSLLERYSVFEANMRATDVGQIKRDSIAVPCTTLDAFLDSVGPDVPSFVKIDAEGSELSVLQGMKRWLEAANVVLMIEVTEQHRAVCELLRDAGFRMFTDRKEPVETVAEVGGNIFCLKPGDRRMREAFGT